MKRILAVFALVAVMAAVAVPVFAAGTTDSTTTAPWYRTYWWAIPAGLAGAVLIIIIKVLKARKAEKEIVEIVGDNEPVAGEIPEPEKETSTPRSRPETVVEERKSNPVLAIGLAFLVAVVVVAISMILSGTMMRSEISSIKDEMKSSVTTAVNRTMAPVRTELEQFRSEVEATKGTVEILTSKMEEFKGNFIEIGKKADGASKAVSSAVAEAKRGAARVVDDRFAALNDPRGPIGRLTSRVENLETGQSAMKEFAGNANDGLNALAFGLAEQDSLNKIRFSALEDSVAVLSAKTEFISDREFSKKELKEMALRVRKRQDALQAAREAALKPVTPAVSDSVVAQSETAPPAEEPKK